MGLTGQSLRWASLLKEGIGQRAASGWDHVWDRQGWERCLNSGRCCDVGAPQLLSLWLLSLLSRQFWGITRKKKKELIAVGLPRVRQGEGDVSFLELSGQSFVCCVGRAPRIEGNSVVPELGFFFSFMPSPAPLSPCNLFGLKISFPNSLRAVLLF